jgi:hypothetical protein
MAMPPPYSLVCQQNSAHVNIAVWPKICIPPPFVTMNNRFCHMDNLGHDRSRRMWTMPQSKFRNTIGFINPASLHFTVTEGTKSDISLTERTQAISACEQTVTEKLRFPRIYDTPAVCLASASKYTYVALQLKIGLPMDQKGSRTNVKRIWMETSKIHHISLAYLPYIPELTRSHMKKDLDDLITEWIASGFNLMAKPEDRARACLSFRQITSAGEDGIYQHHDIVDLSIGQLMKDAHKGTAWLRSPGPHGNNLIDLQHFYKREMQRVNEAVINAFDHQIKPDSPIDVDLHECNVTQFSDIYSLLFYAKERLETRHRIWSMNPIQDVGLIKPEAWHITPICIPYGDTLPVPIDGHHESIEVELIQGRLAIWFETYFLSIEGNASP